MKVLIMTDAEVETLVRRVASETLAAFREEIAFDADGRPTEAGEFLDKKQAAKILGCSQSTVNNLARSGRLPRHRVGSKSVRFRRADVMAIFDRKKP